MIAESQSDWGPADCPSAALRDAALLLAAVLTCLYALDAAELFDLLPGEAAVLLGIAGLQAAWLVAGRRLARGALLAGAALNVLLVALWFASRTVGLPIGSGGAQPVGILDALCAVDSAITVGVTLALAFRSGSGSPRWASAQPRALAVVLAIASLAALHTHAATAQRTSVTTAGPRGVHYHLFCQLL